MRVELGEPDAAARCVDEHTLARTQVAEAMHKYGQRLKVKTVPIYGGASFGQQQRMLQRGVDVVSAGGTVNVEAGSFTENVSITKNVACTSCRASVSSSTGVASGFGPSSNVR